MDYLASNALYYLNKLSDYIIEYKFYIEESDFYKNFMKYEKKLVAYLYHENEIIDITDEIDTIELNEYFENNAHLELVYQTSDKKYRLIFEKDDELILPIRFEKRDDKIVYAEIEKSDEKIEITDLLKEYFNANDEIKFEHIMKWHNGDVIKIYDVNGNEYVFKQGDIIRLV